MYSSVINVVIYRTFHNPNMSPTRSISTVCLRLVY
nr:MAG TPA: hypothetical protein [Caudoviricetes sp.]